MTGALAVAAVAVALVALAWIWAALRIREARRAGDLRVERAGREADARAAEAIRQRDLHLATYGYTAADVTAARAQAVTQSRSVVSGKVQEHLAPLFPEFLGEFDPREARFIGSPIDYVVFNGIDDGECEVVLVEIKTGRSQLSQRERRARRAAEAGRIRWVEMRLPDEVTGEVLRPVGPARPVGSVSPVGPVGPVGELPGPPSSL